MAALPKIGGSLPSVGSKRPRPEEGTPSVGGLSDWELALTNFLDNEGGYLEKTSAENFVKLLVDAKEVRATIAPPDNRNLPQP